jgi:hypothetical protein
VEARPRYFALYERGFLKVELHPSFTTVIAETAIHSEPTTGLGKMSYGKTRQRRSAVKLANAEGKTAVGIGVQTNSPDMVEMAAAANFDFVYLDFKHGSFGFDSAIHLIRAAEASGITPLVRVRDHTPSFIICVRDAGAMVVIVPNVKSVAEAQSVVSAAKYTWKLQWRIARCVSGDAGYLAQGSRLARVLDFFIESGTLPTL